MSTPVANWQGAPAPTTRRLEGRFIVLEKLDATRHGDDLYRALEGPGADPKLWDYLPYGPFPQRSAFNDWLDGHAASAAMRRAPIRTSSPWSTRPAAKSRACSA